MERLELKLLLLSVVLLFCAVGIAWGDSQMLDLSVFAEILEEA